jgi:hypothetical protein
VAEAPFGSLVCESSDFSEAPPPPSSAPLPPNTPTPPTPPPTQIAWEAASAMVFWEDNALNPFSGNLAFFQANANLADMASFNIVGEGITSIVGLDTLVDVETIFLDNNALTSLPALPDTGHLLTFSAASNQITSIASFAGTIATLSIGGNPGLTSVPPLPAPLSFFDFSLTGFNAAGVKDLLGQLVTNGLNNGTVALVSMDASTSGAEIATLGGRGWTVIT